MKIDDIITILMTQYSDIIVKNSWGETALFYNPDNILPRGKYFATIKENDGENDASSNLNQDELSFRLNFKISQKTFLTLFNESKLPKRPAKGGIITLYSGKAYVPSARNLLMPHPVYGWMSWVSVINPSKDTFSHMIAQGLFQESYANAIALFKKDKKPKTNVL